MLLLLRNPVWVAVGIIQPLFYLLLFAPLMNTVIQPIMLLAGIFLPLTFAPQWLKNVANVNPFKWATDGVRALFAGNPGDDAVWQALAILTPLTVLALVISSRT